MKKAKKKSSYAAKKPSKVAFFKISPLVERKPLSTLIPNVSGQKQTAVDALIKQFTGISVTSHEVDKTPGGVHIKADSQGVCGVTASGSKLIYSPSKSLSITITSPDGESRESVELALLVRERDYVPKQKHSLFSSLALSPVSDESSLSIVATPETRESQPPRKKARKESVAVKNTAKGLVLDYFDACGVEIALAEIEKENWNLCHLLSYGIAMNAKTEDAETFNTQIYQNLYSGTRVFNENMMRIENVLLKILNDHDAVKINYLALASEFKDSHILAALTLKISIEIKNGAVISFDVPFDVSDDRKLSHEASTVFYSTIKALSASFDKDEPDDTVSKTLSF